MLKADDVVGSFGNERSVVIARDAISMFSTRIYLHIHQAARPIRMIAISAVVLMALVYASVVYGDSSDDDEPGLCIELL